MAKLPVVRPLKAKLNHTGLRPDRNALTPERIFVEEWVELNIPKVGFNSELGALDHILNVEEDRPCASLPMKVSPVSQRDADVAATVIQWLGTKEGLLFLHRCERRIEQAHKEELEAFHRVNNLGLPA